MLLGEVTSVGDEAMQQQLIKKSNKTASQSRSRNFIPLAAYDKLNKQHQRGE